MKKYFRQAYLDNKNFWNKKRLSLLAESLGLLAIALIIQKVADVYVGYLKGTYVPDLLLDHLPTVDLDFFIVQGALILTFVIIFLLLVKPRYFSFTIKALALFIITRSFFISLTHLGVSPRQLPLDTDSIGFSLYNWLYNSSGDFFFSGHTGTPYLMALIFWHEKLWRRFFLTCSIIFGISVLLAKIHYSIDVFAAPFMTYGIYTIAKTVFRKDFAQTHDKRALKINS